MDEKGLIKYECFHQFAEMDKSQALEDLIYYRNKAFQKGYIGVYSNGIGYGNISIRIGENFMVSGSATGMIAQTGEEHYSLVTEWNIEKNQLWCEGPVKASSESLTHAVIYETLPKINAVLHIHSSDLWEKYYHELPSTSKDIEYGTVKMAQAVKSLLQSMSEKQHHIFLMQGHQDGIVAFGNSLKDLLKFVDQL